MPYALQDDAGKILALYEQQEDINAQWLDDNAPAVVSFKQNLLVSAKTAQQLASSDMELIRVLEDVVELLIKKQIFVFTDLPEFAQAKLSKRQKMRSDMVSLTSLIGNDDDGIF
ncbi:MAG: hypothetical protein Q7U38_02720 [Methylobacter sp.]|nr:hypothetical protein [Methylobacter sp.]MDP2100184.1 hypothetical protein [Methylobacter sp.]MDP2426919.1 hypothetical protein [Methylobacter sp.]MDP3053637.1 hypothetical protein [Methylobacter sp.]MDP3360792.1 hypothetical protein [Methylobacter sp.]